MDINAVNGTLPDLSPTRRRLDFKFYLNTQGRMYKVMVIPVTPYSAFYVISIKYESAFRCVWTPCHALGPRRDLWLNHPVDKYSHCQWSR